jgi:hypothetical protein
MSDPFYKPQFIQAVLEGNYAVVVSFNKYLTIQSCTRNFQQRKCKLNNGVKTSRTNKTGIKAKVYLKKHITKYLKQVQNFPRI